MDILLIVVAILFFFFGFIGCILPFIPGMPFCYIAILLLHFTERIGFSTEFLVFWLLLVLILSVIDYYLPIWGTRRFGGSRWGVWGSTIGLIVGLFFAPWGIIAGPFLGAVTGELLGGETKKTAFKSGLGSFIGFVFGTLAKLVVSGFLIYYGAVALIQVYF